MADVTRSFITRADAEAFAKKAGVPKSKWDDAIEARGVAFSVTVDEAAADKADKEDDASSNESGPTNT